jgi:CPA1 family monovalent cation:H+ antiporter|tara:strand:+ start:171 stop:1367 length:1197 start_codon:yes stop_codon:yes gene_type:complete
MATVLLLLTYLAIILLIGLLTSIVSQKFRIPNILLLLLIGIGIGHIDYRGGSLIEFPDVFMTSISILALVMIVFDSSSRFSLKKVDYFSLHTLWLSLVFLVFNLVFLTAFTMLIFGVKSIFLALIFASLMAGTSPAVVLSMFKDVKNKVFEFLSLESLLNTPLVVLIPFIILDLKNVLKDELIIATFIDQFVPLLQQFVVGIGSGVLIGLIMFKFMKKAYSVVLSPLAVITSALLAYIIAENLNGNGVLAVTSMGLLFGNVYLKQKFQLREFASVFSNSLEILVFVLIGLIVSLPLSIDFFIRSIVLFILYLGIRYLSIIFSLRGMDFTMKEKIFMSLNVQKGIAVAVVVFSLANLNIDGMGTILNLSLTFMLYSIILSSVVLRIAKFFISEIGEKKN